MPTASRITVCRPSSIPELSSASSSTPSANAPATLITNVTNGKVNIGTAMNKGLTLRMAQCNVKRYMPALLEHIRAGRIDAKAIISHRFPLEEAELAYHVFDNKLDDCVKCVLIPPEAA